MAADFPSTKKTFTQVVDGTDFTEATQINQPYDEIEAVETFIGAMGRDQSYNTSLKALLKNYRAGCACEYKSATELTVLTGEIYIPDASGNGAYRQNTSDVTVTWAMIDTGSEESSTVYYVYAVADSAATTFTVKISKSATEAAFRTSSGASYCRQIGTFYNDASSNIQEVGNLTTSDRFGNWVAKADNTVYRAITDGFLVATVYADTTQSSGYILGHTDGSNPPTTVRAQCSAATLEAVYSGSPWRWGSFCMPVRRGDYYKGVKAAGNGSITAAYYWLPR